MPSPVSVGQGREDFLEEVVPEMRDEGQRRVIRIERSRKRSSR